MKTEEIKSILTKQLGKERLLALLGQPRRLSEEELLKACYDVGNGSHADNLEARDALMSLECIRRCGSRAQLPDLERHAKAYPAVAFRVTEVKAQLAARAELKRKRQEEKKPQPSPAAAKPKPKEDSVAVKGKAAPSV